jgi:cyclomaltodextrinase
LNHDEPEVADYVTSVMNYWLRRGADGWRLDAAYAVPRRFWANVLSNVRTDYPDAYLFGEVIHGDYAGFVRETGGRCGHPIRALEGYLERAERSQFL